MKRVALTAVLGAALLAAPAAVQAHPGHTKGKRCATVKKAFVVRGTLSSFSDPTVVVTVKRANRHARRALAGSTTFSFDLTAGTWTKFRRRSGFTGSNPAQAGDWIRVRGKIAYQKRSSRKHPCDNGGTYGDVTVRAVRVRASR